MIADWSFLPAIKKNFWKFYISLEPPDLPHTCKSLEHNGYNTARVVL